MISFRELVRRRYVRRGVIVFAVATAALGSGVAYAAWTSTGTGSATTKAGTAQAPVVSGGAVTTGLLYPTGTATGTAQQPGTAIAADGTATITLPNSVAMLTSAADACQGKDFAIPVTVTIVSGS